MSRTTALLQALGVVIGAVFLALGIVTTNGSYVHCDIHQHMDTPDDTCRVVDEETGEATVYDYEGRKRFLREEEGPLTIVTGSIVAAGSVGWAIGSFIWRRRHRPR